MQRLDLVAPPLSLSSGSESSRILAIGGIRQSPGELTELTRRRDRPNLDPAVQEVNIRGQLEAIREQIAALLEDTTSDSEEQSEEKKQSILLLRLQLRQVRQRQENLRSKLVTAKRLQQEMQNDGKSAAASRSAYTASVVRMEELRDINKVSLTPQEVKARDLEMQRSRRTLVSGGLVGFKVAPDLHRKDFRIRHVEGSYKLHK